MSLLASVEKPKDRNPIVTIFSDSGMGKTTLASRFPKPIFIRTEDGMQAIPEKHRPDAFPVVEQVDALWEQLTALMKEEHSYKTLVLDSVTALERLFIQYVIDSDPKKPRSINQALGGYGAGLAAVASLHQRVRKACGVLNERKGMSIVFIGHADTEVIELPDSDPYTRYSLRLGRKSVAPYVDDSDVVIRLQTYTTGDGERKKAISDGSRLLVTYATANNLSKNRYNITEDLPFKLGENPLAAIIPSLKSEK